MAQLDLQRPCLFLVVRKQMDPNHVSRMEREYRRFITLVAAFPGEKFPISNAVDELWHAHLLFSRDYEAFSRSVRPEGGMIHHQPTLNDAERDALKPRYFDGTLARYKEVFQEEPPAEFWPSADAEICWSCTT